MSSASGKRSASIEELLNDASSLQSKGRTSTARKEEAKQDVATEKFAKIAENTFYKIVFSDASPEEKVKAIAEARTYNAAQTKQENKARMDEYAAFKEYVHFERKRMAQEIIKLTDTDTFGELKKVFEDMNLALLDFEGELTPIMQILDAVYELNKAGGDAVYDVFKQIEEDRKREKELAEQRAKQERQLQDEENEIRRIRLRNAELAEQKSFFGFGGIKPDARAEITRNEALLTEKQQNLADLGEDIRKTSEAQKEVRGNTQYQAQKEQIRKLLDISSEEHKERSTRLVNKANHYIDTSYERTTSVLDGLRRLSGQIDNLADANSGMHQVFAILSDGGKTADRQNEALRVDLQKAPEGETAIAKMTREGKLNEVQEFIQLGLEQSADDVRAIESLSKESLQIRSLRDTNRQQISGTQTLSSSGVSGVASSLATALQGVTAASLDQSRETSELNLRKMNSITEEHLKKGVMTAVMGLQRQNQALEQAISTAAQTKEFVDKVNTATRSAIADQFDLINELQDKAESLKKSVDESQAISAETISDDLNKAARDTKKPANDSKPEEKKAPTSPFNFGGGPR